MKVYKISEIAKLSGVSVKALRGYEEKGLLKPVRQIESNYRLYSENMVDVIKNIKFLQNLGFTLKEVSLIRDEEDLSTNRLNSIFKSQLRETNDQISNLSERKLILSNIINKLNDEDMKSSSILTAKEKDVFMGITTGFTKLDQLLRSERKDNLVVIAARPGMGKTALTVHIALNLMEQTQLPILFFSTEFDHREWTKRLTIQKCEIDYKFDSLDAEDKVNYERTYTEIKNKPIFYRHHKIITLDEITTKPRELTREIGAVVVDYLQDIQGNDEKKCLELKKLAKDLNCPVIAISTVAESADKRTMPVPEDVINYKDMKGSVDKLILVSRNPKLIIDDTKHIARIDVYSDNFDQSQNVNLVWDGAYCGYSDTL